LITQRLASAVHDVSDGGLLVALAEMAMAGGIGAELEVAPFAAHAFWFGEEQGRYVVTATAAAAEGIIARARAAGVPARRIGTTGGQALTLKGDRPILVAKLRDSFESWFPAYMGGGGP
jgi:phosphoribosylformylglycinamidine synthase